MPLKFSTFCALLSELEDIEYHDPPYIKPLKVSRLTDATEQWFRSNRLFIDSLSTDGATALLSALLPEWRTDRVYGFQAPGLCRMLGRLLNLGGPRLKDLQAYREPGRGDLGECLERVQRAGGVLGRPALTLEEVDDMLQNQASRSRFSDRAIASSSVDERNKTLGNVLRRASPVESKWLVRLLLKDFSPVHIDQSVVLRCFHFLLPGLLRFQRDFRAAVAQLRTSLSDFPTSPDSRSEADFCKAAGGKLRPQVGVKVGRPDFQKCRGIDHCMKIVGNQRWVLERKYDGEYCEIHINLTLPRPQWIKIFSKSGKNSTDDRKALHQTLVDCLRLGQPDCRIKQCAILLGELVVYSDKDRRILPFEKIRKHVTRSDQFIGTYLDSQPHAFEHLAIVFFDLLLWDDEVVMAKSVDQRRLMLRETYVKRHGRAMGAEWKILDFSDGELAKRRLIEQFAASNAQRCEGIILKPLGVPYFSPENSAAQQRQSIKLKKDYIDSMADEADFAVVGASYDAQIALRWGIDNLKWTSFHLACLTNKTDVVRFDARPQFRFVATIDDVSCIPLATLQTVNSLGPFVGKTYDSTAANHPFDLKVWRTVKIDTLFATPFVCEVIGSEFVKPSNCNYYMLRHPRVKKLHDDRCWKDCVSFQELQEQAEASRMGPHDSESQETKRWVAKLERSCKRKFTRDKTMLQHNGTISPATNRRTPTPIADTIEVSPLVSVPEDQVSFAKRVSDPSIPIPSRNIKRQRTATVQNMPDMTSSLCAYDDSPLSDITNQARVRQDKTILKQPVQMLVPSTEMSTKVTHIDIFQAKRRVCTHTKCASQCLFVAAAVLLAPCIQNYLYVCDDLLPMHDISAVSNIAHWNRNSFAYPPLSETISESQAYAGLRKIILVERRRQLAVLDILNSVRSLNVGHFRERIEVYDWRVLEDCHFHDKGADGLADHFIGASVFDDTLKRAVLVSELPWIAT